MEEGGGGKPINCLPSLFDLYVHLTHWSGDDKHW